MVAQLPGCSAARRACHTCIVVLHVISAAPCTGGELQHIRRSGTVGLLRGSECDVADVEQCRAAPQNTKPSAKGITVSCCAAPDSWITKCYSLPTNWQHTPYVQACTWSSHSQCGTKRRGVGERVAARPRNLQDDERNSRCNLEVPRKKQHAWRWWACLANQTKYTSHATRA